MIVLVSCHARSPALTPPKPVVPVTPVAAAPAPAPAPTPVPATPVPPAPTEPACATDCLDEAQVAFEHKDRDRAIVLAYAACNRDNAEACSLLADVLDRFHVSERYGTTPTKLRDRAFLTLTTKCDAKTAAACFALGKIEFAGKRPSKTREDGQTHILAACDLNDGQACSYAVRFAPKRTDELLDKACKLDNARGCALLGDRDKKRSHELWTRACTANDAYACGRLGEAAKRANKLADAATAYETACELAKDGNCVEAGQLAEAKAPEHARELYDLGCKSEHGPSCVRHAMLLGTSRGGARAYGTSLELYEKGCKLETPGACDAEKRARAHPPDGTCTTTEACTALCAEGIPKSCTRVGDLANCDERANAYEHACAMGEATACERRGDLEELDHAPEWYAKACDAGDHAACTLRELADRVAAYPGALPGPKAKILARLHALCASNQHDACLWAAAKEVIDGDARKADAMMHRACDHNDGRACRMLAEQTGLYAGGGATSSDPDPRPEDVAAHARGLVFAKRGCGFGDDRACTLAELPVKSACSGRVWEEGL